MVVFEICFEVNFNLFVNYVSLKLYKYKDNVIGCWSVLVCRFLFIYKYVIILIVLE